VFTVYFSGSPPPASTEKAILQEMKWLPESCAEPFKGNHHYKQLNQRYTGSYATTLNTLTVNIHLIPLEVNTIYV